MATPMTVPDPSMAAPPPTGTGTPVIAGLIQDDGLRRTRATALAHMSVEVGHLYADQLRSSDDALTETFARAARKLPSDLRDQLRLTTQARRLESRRQPGSERSVSPRISTCVLVDDYSCVPPTEPGEALPRVIAAATRAGLRLDYVAREAACAQVDDISPVALLVRALVAEPPEGTTGARPPAFLSGWVCNGVRSPDPVAPAMSSARWQPPRQNAPEGHSIVIDVELWSPYDAAAAQAPPVAATSDRVDRRWSCTALATTWQVLRLGLLRHRGEPVWGVHDLPRSWPGTWAELPPLIRVHPTATSFTAYRTLSLLPCTFLLAESGVRTVLGQVAGDPELLKDIATRADAEGTPVPTRIDDRVEYVFYSDS